MYGPPLNRKKNRFRREQSAKMYPASEWRVISGRMMMIRARLLLGHYRARVGVFISPNLTFTICRPHPIRTFPDTEESFP
jgi:ribosomal protein L32E